MISTNPADWIGKRVHMTQAGAKALAGMYRKCKGAGVVTRWTRLTAEYVNVRPDNYKKATRFAAEFWEEIEVSDQLRPVACPDCNLDAGLLCRKHNAFDLSQQVHRKNTSAAELSFATCTPESCAPECVNGELPCPFAQGRGRKPEPRFCGHSVCGDRGGPAEACGKELPCVDHPARLSKYEHDRFCGQCGAEQPCATHCRYRAIQAETGIWFLWRCVDRTWETVGQVEVFTLAALGDLADLTS